MTPIERLEALAVRCEENDACMTPERRGATFWAYDAKAIRHVLAYISRLEGLLTSSSGISASDLEDAADLVAGENGYLSRQLSGAAVAFRAALTRADE